MASDPTFVQGLNLAERAGLHRTYIGSIERGEPNLSLMNIHRLAAALGVDVPTLMAAAAAEGRH